MRWSFVVVGALVAVGACGRATGERGGAAGDVVVKATTTQSFTAAPARVAGVMPFFGQPRRGGGAGPSGERSPLPIPTERKAIRNGLLKLEVPSLDPALANIKAVTASSGGYVVGESQERDEFGARQGSITCRIPAAKLDATLTTFRGYGKTQSVNLTSDDITEQYFNVEIRLRNAQQLEERLLKLLEKAGNKVSDLVEVEREVARVRGEIDQLEGRRRLWDSQVACSTLIIEVREPRRAITGSGGGIVDTLKQSFRQTGENFVATLAWIVEAAGVFIPAAIVLWLLWRVWKALRAWRKR
jgi:hypothetical protein